jgi:hypothetical protein
MLDLYWAMSYSRWKDEQFWPAFRDLLKGEHPQLNNESLQWAREFNDKRYYYQGIGGFAPAAAYARGITNLHILADLIPMGSYTFGAKPTSVGAAVLWIHCQYLFFLPIKTPLKQFFDSHPNLIRHCTAIAKQRREWARFFRPRCCTQSTLQRLLSSRHAPKPVNRKAPAPNMRQAGKPMK